jgi:hypothetical protein
MTTDPSRAEKAINNIKSQMAEERQKALIAPLKDLYKKEADAKLVLSKIQEEITEAEGKIYAELG